MSEEIPYSEAHKKVRSADDTYRDEEEAEYEAARRKGKVMDLVLKDVKKAMKDALSKR